MPSVQRKWSRARWTALTGVVIAVGSLAVYLAVYHVGRIGRLDYRLFYDFVGLSGHRSVHSLANIFVSLCDPGPYDYLVAIVIGLALIRRRFLLAASLLVMILGAIGTAEVLKPALAALHPGVPATTPQLAGSWPSGHSTAATALSLALVLAAPPRLRPYAAVLGAAFAGAVIYSVLVLGWHYPSDAVGGIGIAAAWGSATIAGISAIEARRCARRPREPVTAGLSPTKPPASLTAALTPPVLAVCTVLAAALGLLILRPTATVDYVNSHHVLVAVVAILALLSILAATAAALAVRR